MSDFVSLSMNTIAISLDTRPAKVLAAWAHKMMVVLDRQGRHIEWEIEMVGEKHLVDSLGQPPGDGVWVWEGGLVATGTRSWEEGGGMEYELDGVWRPVSEKEWANYIEGVKVWEVIPSAMQEAIVASRKSENSCKPT